MDNGTRNKRLRRLMYKEIREMSEKYKDECKYLGSHTETEGEKRERLKRAECEAKRKNRWTLHK